MAEIDLTQREVIIVPKLPGQKFVFKGGLKIATAKRGSTSTTAAVQVAGTWVDPTPPPPAPKPLAYATSIAAGSTLKGNVEWLATVTAGVATSFDFLVDDVVHWHELAAPWGGTFDTTKITNGKHRMTVVGFDASGPRPAAGGEVTIDNAVVVPPGPEPPGPPPPPPTPPTGIVADVGNATELLKALADDRVDLVAAHDGTYSGDFRIGAKYAARTRPVIVKAVTRHKAIIAGSLLRFEEGAHHQQWLGFRHSNMTVASNGVITLGGYGGTKAAHHLDVGDFWIDSTCKAASGPDGAQDHAIYPAHGTDDGPHHVVFHDFLIDADNLNGGLHSWHPEQGQAGFQPHDMAFQRGIIRNARWGIATGHLLPLVRYLYEDLDIVGSRSAAVAWWLLPKVDSVMFRRVISTNSATVFKLEGSPKPLPPGLPGMAFEACSFA